MSIMTLLSAKGISKRYVRRDSPQITVLEELDIEVNEGDKIAILGKSGSGKSTLLHILGTLDRPSSGTLAFHGKDLLRQTEASLSHFRNSRLGFVFQFHYLMLEFTALENVMMPGLIAGLTNQEAKRRALELLAKVGLEQRLDHRPAQLSGGEQSRVAIARALVLRPPLLLTDEMTGNLDAATGRQVFDLIQSLYDEFKMALVSVTHDETLANEYHRVLRLESGRLSVVK